MAKITYEDKIVGAKWTAADANEVKESVNDLYDVVDSTSAEVLQKTRVVCWGDSLTIGDSSLGSNFVNQLADQLGLSTANKGVNGNSSSQILTRFNADPANWVYPTIIWSGRNNFSNPTQVKADIASMVASLGHTNYLVLSILNSDVVAEYIGQPDYVTITTLNSNLSAVYGSRFLDVRAYLLTQGNGSANDNTDIANGVPPRSLRTDTVHLNGLGYSKIANYIVAHGSSFITPDIDKPLSINSVRTLFNNAPNIGGDILAKGYFDRLMVGSNDNTLTTAPFSVFTTTNLREQVTINSGGEALKLGVDTGDADQVFAGFYAKNAASTTRSASVGYVGIGDTKFTLANTIGRVEMTSNELASSGTSRGFLNTGTLTASANNDFLIGMEIEPVYTPLSFTGITQIGLRIKRRGTYHIALGDTNTSGSIGFARGLDGGFTSSMGFKTATESSIFAFSNTGGGGNYEWQLNISGGGVDTAMKLFNTGNFMLKAGGTFTDDAVNRLQVAGSVKATQYNLSALNTAPPSATATGTLGEIRYTATHIYVCTATNTWVRAALATW